MRKALLILAAAVLASAPLGAQVRPRPAGGDPHIQIVDYAPDQVILLEGAPGYQLTVQLAPDEQVQNIAVGDSTAWQVSANRSGNNLFVKAVVAGVSTNMTVITNVRLYNFELLPFSGSDMPYTVQLRYPPAAPEPSDDAPRAVGEGRYHVTGDKALRPSEISDDGTHTYIRWPRDRSLPAVYAVSDTGEETLVNGMMREDDVFMIDSVSRKLVFRVDERKASATRARVRR